MGDEFISKEQKIELIQRYRKDYVGGKNLAVADELLPLEFTLNGEKFKLESHKKMIEFWHKVFPDLEFTIQDIFSIENRVVERFMFRGTHKGDLYGIAPTGRKVEAMGILIHHIEEGKIVEIWEVLDIFGLLGQLGIKLPMG